MTTSDWSSEVGTVYWITGLSGAGKTTIGRLLYERLKKEMPQTVFLDGDTMREVFGGDLGYSKEERRACAMRYSRLCKLLSDQGIHVICCTISMFDSVREWNRNNISYYFEVYVRVSMDILRGRNQKGLYRKETKESIELVVGIDIDFEEPKSPNLVLDNDENIDPELLVDKIVCESMARYK